MQFLSVDFFSYKSLKYLKNILKLYKTPDEPDMFLEGGETHALHFSCAKYRVTVVKDWKDSLGRKTRAPVSV